MQQRENFIFVRENIDAIKSFNLSRKVCEIKRGRIGLLRVMVVRSSP